MSKRSLMPIAAICITMLAGMGSALASSSPAADTAGRLDSAITLDRATYFPGEDAVLTLIARNPQRTPLEAPTPFAATTGCFDLFKLGTAGWLIPVSSHPVCPFRPMEPASDKTVFEPGEERRATVSAEALWRNSDTSASRAGTGYYQVAYRNSTASAVFRIVAPRLEAATSVRLHDIPYEDPATGRTTLLPAYLHIFSVRWNNQSFLCVTQSPSMQNKAVVTDGAGNVTSVNTPYRRLKALDHAIASIKATANQKDNLTITVVDSTGTPQTVLAPGTRHAPAAGSIEVGLESTFESVVPNASLQLRARVAGAANNSVRWSVALGPGAPAGVETGSVTATGRYVAPAAVNVRYAVIVSAQSLVDSSKSALGVVSLQPQNEITAAGPSDAAGLPNKPGSPVTVSAAAARGTVAQ